MCLSTSRKMLCSRCYYVFLFLDLVSTNQHFMAHTLDMML